MQPAFSSSEISIPLSSGDEITTERFSADGDYLLLWFAPEYGFREPHRSLARALTKNKIEVWQSNVVESMFMPQGVTSIRELDGVHVADLIDYAHKQTGKQIVVAGDSYASVTALRGARYWQSRSSSNALIGAILFSPYTYSRIPALGHEPTYLPIIQSSNIPIMIYQAKHSGIISQFKTLVAHLQQHDAPVYTRFTPNIMSLFYEKEVSEQMRLQVKPLPRHISNMIPILATHNIPSKPIKLTKKDDGNNGLDSELKAFSSHQKPLSIKLLDTSGNKVEKSNYNDRVTIINFWATWCPPCIEEIPSLNRLNDLLKDKPFDLISINYAQDKKTIVDFMKKVSVKFPVLLDKDGAFATQWNVITYPSTFIIDTEGNIVYGVNSAIAWDSPEVIKKIKTLFR